MTTNLEDRLAALPGADTGTIDNGDMVELLGGLLNPGDSGPTPRSEASPSSAATDLTIDPGAAPADDAAASSSGKDAAAPAAAPAVPDKQVILAKDGVHTIPFERLEEARSTAAVEKARADTLARENAELQARLNAPKAAPAPAPAADGGEATDGDEDDETLFGDYSGKAMKGAVLKLATQIAQQQTAALREELKGQLTPAQEKTAVDASTQHYQQILTAHPDAHSIAESQEFAVWKAAQPSFARAAMDTVLEKGTAAEVVELLDSYRGANPRAAAPAPAPASPARASAAALAQKALDNATSRTPSSLSDIPAGSQVVTDEAEAIKGMEPTALLDQMLSMSADQRDAYINRVV